MLRSKSISTKSTRVFFALAFFASVASVNVASATDFFVSSASDIDSAVRNARPGDTLIMTNGTWTNQEIDFEGFGTAANPITLRAETPGQVILNGSSRLSISGEWLVVNGLNFEGGSISSGNVVEFRGGEGEAFNCRFTNSCLLYTSPSPRD